MRGLAVDFRLADAPGDDVRHLRAKVDDQKAVVGVVFHELAL